MSEQNELTIIATLERILAELQTMNERSEVRMSETAGTSINADKLIESVMQMLPNLQREG